MKKKKADPPADQPPVLVRDLVAAVDDIAPFRLAEDWDRVGLQFGRADAAVRKVLLALDVTPDVIAEAVRIGAETLLVHHPLLFKIPKTLEESEPLPRLIAEVIRARLNVIAAHTNLDCVADGTNGEVADRIGLVDRHFLVPKPSLARYKYVVFVPSSHVEAVIQACDRAGAGVIGNYSHCTFRSPGTGTYLPLEGANPYKGKVGKVEEAKGEYRLEVVCPPERVFRLIEEVRKVHPYETIAEDVIPLYEVGKPEHGLGLVGTLEEQSAPETLEAFSRRCKAAFHLNSIGVVGDLRKPVRRVAICTGGGGDFVRNAAKCGADVYVTGEMNHHHAEDARQRGLGVVLLGHFASEAIVAPRLVRLLEQHHDLRGRGLQFIVSQSESAPVVRL